MVNRDAVIVRLFLRGESVLVLVGTVDPDRADPYAEGSAIADALIVDALSSALGRLEATEGAGHCPRDQFPGLQVSMDRAR
ncbi:hypothetical protein ACFYQA_34810 [Streptomyces sp. NPDC005774]|uniref:hypothetical protein n=1 Tax=Streptomyces sp. NPDC005774 TaxID=3364728 RepID=UPI00369F658C